MVTVREVFETPHDCRPKWVFMLTAYLDESGHEGKDIVLLSGFLGTAEQWEKCESDWQSALKERQRKHLHMTKLRWGKPERLRPLLSTLGPIPHAAGLQAVCSAVKVGDFEDLVDGTLMQKFWKGYFIVLLGMIDVVAKGIPAEETFKLVLEAQDTYEAGAHQIFLGTRDLRTPSGKRKLVSLEYIEKDDSVLTEPADYLAYAQFQNYRNPKSIKSELSLPILTMRRPGLARNHLIEKDHLRTFVKGMIARYPNLMQSVKTDGSQQR